MGGVARDNISKPVDYIGGEQISYAINACDTLYRANEQAYCERYNEKISGYFDPKPEWNLINIQPLREELVSAVAEYEYQTGDLVGYENSDACKIIQLAKNEIVKSLPLGSGGWMKFDIDSMSSRRVIAERVI